METTTESTVKNNRIPAVFLDRDGTIIEDCGDLSHPSQVKFFKDTVTSLRRLSEHFALFIVTNQSGVAKGTISMQEVEQVNTYIRSYLSAQGIPILATYVCPHKRASGCHCIKPNPYFLEKAEQEFGIDLGRSFVLGDHPHDVEFGKNAGLHAIYLLSGHGMKHQEELSEDTDVAEGIHEATEIILEQVL
jgi:histidinol-phosphate phosphatase family protein